MRASKGDSSHEPASSGSLLPLTRHLLPKPRYTRTFPAAGGSRVRFVEQGQSWQAELIDTPHAPSAVARRVSVVGPHDTHTFLAWLIQQDDATAKARIHVLPTSQPPYTSAVYLGKLGLFGGMPQQGEDNTSQRPYDVFISHAGEDKDTIAEPLCNELTARNPHIRAFLDRPELPYGRDSHDHMINAMNTARCGVFILSPEFAAKEWPMKELDCFLKRQEENNPPAMLPVFYRLTWGECGLSYDIFFKKYKKYFEDKRDKFHERVQAGEISEEGVMQSLKRLRTFRGVELEKSKKDPLIHKLIGDTANKVYEMLAGMLPMATFSPGASSGYLHEHINFPEVGHYIPRALETTAVRERLNEKGICIIHGFGGSGKSNTDPFFV